MCSDKTDMKKPLKEYDNGYQTIFISRDIKDISVISDIVGRRKRIFQVGMTLPFCLFNIFCPTHQCIFRIGMFPSKGFKQLKL